jgi:hypothetical protein
VPGFFRRMTTALLSFGAAVFGAFLAGYAGFLLAEAVVPPPATHDSLKPSLLLVAHMAIMHALAGAAICFWVVLRVQMRFNHGKTRATPLHVAAVLAPSVAVAIAMLAILARWYSVKCEFNKEAAKIRAAGYLADLRSYESASPAEKQTAAVFIEALSLIAPGTDSQLPLLSDYPLTESYTWRQIKQAEPMLRANEKCLGLLHSTVGAAPARYPIEEDASPVTAGWMELATAARLLAVEACIRMSHGDPLNAAQSIHALLALMHSFDHAPFSGLSDRKYCEKLACETIASLLPLGNIPVEDLHRFNDSLSSANRIEAMHRVIVGLKSLAIDVVLRSAAERHAPAYYLLDWLLLTEAKADCIRYVRFLDQTDECLDRPWPECARTIQEAVARLRSSLGQSPFTAVLHPFTSSTIYLDIDNWLPARQLANEARVKIVRILIAVDQYRREKGELPRNLAALVPKHLAEVPMDPFTQHALQAVHAGKNGILAYSVGPNCLDEKGEGDDVGIRVDYDSAERLRKIHAGD